MSAVKNHRPSVPVKVPRALPPVAQAALGPTLSRSRPSWSGLIRLSLVSVPVKDYQAVSSTATSPFHLLHVSRGHHISFATNCPQPGAVECVRIFISAALTLEHSVS